MKQDIKEKLKHTGKGFTLLELMVVILIIGLLAALVGPQVISRMEKAKVTAARAQIAIFKNAVKNYKLDTGQYPDESMGLEALVMEPAGVTGWDSKGYLDATDIPKDPWSFDYDYVYPGDFGEFDIISYGADGKEGGEGEDADIYDSDIIGRETETQP